MGSVLVADDDDELRALYHLSLRHAGYDVVDAVDGADALARLVASPLEFDAAVLDVRMPGVSGLQVLAALQKSTPSVPIILTSAFADENLSEDAARLGAAALLSKPFRLDMLTRAVAYCEEHRRGPNGLVSPPMFLPAPRRNDS
jgi:CheY-like chemotaxis protein